MATQTMGATYLNDHLSGSTAAVELLAHLADSDIDPSAKTILKTLLEEIKADRSTLEGLMTRLAVVQSVGRKAAAWLGEKAARLKLAVDDPAKDALHLLESAEALSLGIEGKRLLWRALLRASDVEPRLSGPDYSELIRRAESHANELNRSGSPPRPRCSHDPRRPLAGRVRGGQQEQEAE